MLTRCILLSSVLWALASCDSAGPPTDPNDLPVTGRIVFSHLDTSATDQNAHLYAVDIDGSDFAQLHSRSDSTFNPDGRAAPRGYATNPHWGPKGQLIVYEESQGPDESHIVVMNADGSHKRNITPVGGYAETAFISPDGTRVLYGDGGWGIIMGYFVEDIDNTNRMCVVCTEEPPPVSSEGHSIGFSPVAWGPTSDLLWGYGGPLKETQGPPETMHVYELRLSTRTVVQRFTDKPISYRPQLHLAPDGRRAFYIERDGREGTLYLLSSLEADPEVLLECAGYFDGCLDFSWANDSRHIVFVQRDVPTEQFNKKLYIMDVDGDRTPVQVPTPFADHDTPALYIPLQ